MALRYVLAYFRDLNDLDPNRIPTGDTWIEDIPVLDPTDAFKSHDSIDGSVSSLAADISGTYIIVYAVYWKEKSAIRRTRIINEIVSSEEAYVGFLQVVYTVLYAL
jgi:hypothetical protein